MTELKVALPDSCLDRGHEVGCTTCAFQRGYDSVVDRVKMFPVEQPDKPRDYFCERCGGRIYADANHSCQVFEPNPMAPFCQNCGKTLHQGWVPSATCSC